MAELLIGSCLLIFVLWLSAYLQPDIAWLHFFKLGCIWPRSLCWCSPADGAISSVCPPLLSRTILMFLSRPISAAGSTGCSSRSTPVSCNESIKSSWSQPGLVIFSSRSVRPGRMRSWGKHGSVTHPFCPHVSSNDRLLGSARCQLSAALPSAFSRNLTPAFAIKILTQQLCK